HEIRLDHLQSNRTLQIRIQSFVGDAHGTTPEFPERAVIALQHAVVVECNPVTHTFHAHGIRSESVKHAPVVCTICSSASQCLRDGRFRLPYTLAFAPDAE